MRSTAASVTNASLAELRPEGDFLIVVQYAETTQPQHFRSQFLSRESVVLGYSLSATGPAAISEREQVFSGEQIHTWMRRAIDRASHALAVGEAPIGCVIVDSAGRVRSEAHNTMYSSRNVTAHAEINALSSLAGQEGVDEGLTLVSTLEPCVMCTGAAMLSGVNAIVYGLVAPADAGTTRVKPPASPGATFPVISGGVMAQPVRRLFERWMQAHVGDASRNKQREFIEQLLALTASEAESS